MAGGANETALRRADIDKFRVFLSYSRKDIDFAEQLVTALEAFNYEIMIDRTGIHAAENWRERLGEMILEVDTVVFLLTPNSTGSEVCRWEVDRALELHKRTVPVLISPLGSSKPHPALQQLNYIRFFPDPAVPGSGWGSGLAQLSTALSVDVDWIREHTRVAGLASRWEKGKQQPDYLARGSELVSLRHWRNTSPANAPALTSLQCAFLDASEAAEIEQQVSERKRLEEMKAAQDARALALLEAENALQQAADAHRRRSRWRNLLFAVVVVAAALSGFLLFRAAEEKREAIAYLQRAMTAELAANRAETEAMKSELRAITNEFTTSVTVLNAQPSSQTSIDNYLETGIRLGFALIRNDRNSDARRHLSKYRGDVLAHSFDKAAEAINFYVALADVGLATAALNEESDSSTRTAANKELFDALTRLRGLRKISNLMGELDENLFRAYFYAVNFMLSSGDYASAFALASEIDQQISSNASAEATLPRLTARSKGLLAWCAILANKPDEALKSAKIVNQIAERFNFVDLNSLRLNYAHALLLNGENVQSIEEYKKSRPEEVKADFQSMLKAGLCYPEFAEYGVFDEKCH